MYRLGFRNRRECIYVGLIGMTNFVISTPAIKKKRRNIVLSAFYSCALYHHLFHLKVNVLSILDILGGVDESMMELDPGEPHA